MNSTQIEEQLGLSLPAGLRAYFDEIPFNDSSFVYRNGLVYLPSSVIRATEEFRTNGFFGKPWPTHYLVIGGDGLGNEFFVDVSRPDSPVFLAEHESSRAPAQLEFAVADNSLRDWIDAMLTTEEWFRSRALEEETL